MGEGDRHLHRRQHLSPIATGALDDEGDGLRRSGGLERVETTLGEGSQAVVVERVEPEQRRAASQRRVDLEERVLRRRPDQRQGPVLDGGKQGILLGLVEAVNLVEEQDRAAVVLAETLASPFDHFPDVLDARRHGRELLELLRGAAGDCQGQRRLAGAWRTPEQHGRQRVGFHETAQRLAGTEQVGLTDDVVDRARP